MTEAGTGAWAALLEGLPDAAWVVALPTQRVVTANAVAALPRLAGLMAPHAVNPAGMAQ